ncbi:MAG: helix-turn-helix domain-containing protein, partial [Sphingobacteriales bacterium]
RAVIMCDGTELDTSVLPYEFGSSPITSNASTFDLSAIEQQHIQRVLKHTQGNRAETARLLNIGIATLYRKLKEYGLE